MATRRPEAAEERPKVVMLSRVRDTAGDRLRRALERTAPAEERRRHLRLLPPPWDGDEPEAAA